MPITAASETAVCAMSTSSISPGEMFSAAPHDHVVEPAVDVEEAVLVEPPRVPGAEPSVLGEGVVPHVLAGHLLAAHPDLALLT